MTGPAIVTGGSSGIGLEIARLLARRGHPLVLIARDRERLGAAGQALEAEGAEVLALPADVADTDAVARAVDRAVETFGPPAWAVANAGIAAPGRFLEQPLEAFETHMRVNYMGALHLARAAAPHMARAGAGRLVFVSSGAAFFGITGYAAYAPPKFAMRGLAEVLRVELAAHGVSVTLAYPPDTRTPMLEAEARLKPPETRAITESGGTWDAGDVARRIVDRAAAGRFAVTPGLQMTLLHHLHSVLAPGLRRWQARMIRKHGR